MLNKLFSDKLNALVNEDLSLLFLRAFSGIMIMTHGIPKLGKVFAGDFTFADPIGLGPEVSLFLAAFAEGVCGFLVAIGLSTRLASAILIINMAVAVFIFHFSDPFGRKELAIMYLALFVGTFLFGGGKFSLDNKLFNK